MLTSSKATQVRCGILAICMVMITAFVGITTITICSTLNKLSESHEHNASIINNLAAFAHYDYVEENRIIESEITKMTATIFAERQVKVTHEESSALADGKIPLCQNIESVEMRFLEAQDNSINLDINIDRDNNIINVKYPSDIFIQSYNFTSHRIEKNTAQEAKELGESIGNDLKTFHTFIVNYWVETLSETEIDSNNEENDEDQLSQMLDLVCLHEGAEMEEYWQKLIRDEMDEKYSNFEVKFENTNPIVISAKQQALLDQIHIEKI